VARQGEGWLSRGTGSQSLANNHGRHYKLLGRKVLAEEVAQEFLGTSWVEDEWGSGLAQAVGLPSVRVNGPSPVNHAGGPHFGLRKV
jgi:hypothetical protein